MNTSAAEHDARLRAIEECAAEARDCWEHGIPAVEIEKRIRALATKPPQGEMEGGA